MSHLHLQRDYHCLHPNLVPIRVQTAYGVTHVNTKDNGKDIGVSALRKRLVYLPVSCGKCENCRKRRNLEWSNRLLMHYYEHQQNKKGFHLAFVTLTFNPKNYEDAFNNHRDLLLDKNGDCIGADYTPIYRHYVRPFFKRLRAERGENLKFSYYCVSEFGETRGRFHFHILLYFTELCEAEASAWSKAHPLHRCWRKDSVGNMRQMSDMEVYLRDKLLRQWTDDVTRKNKATYHLDDRFYVQYHDSDTIGKKSVHCSGEYGHIDLVIPDNAGMIRYVTNYTNKCIKDGTSTFNRQSCGVARDFGKMIATDIFYEAYDKIKLNIDGKEVSFGMPKYFLRKFGNPVTRTQRFWENYDNICKEFIAEFYPSCETIEEVVYIRNQERLATISEYEEALNASALIQREEFGSEFYCQSFEDYFVKHKTI